MSIKQSNTTLSQDPSIFESQAINVNAEKDVNNNNRKIISGTESIIFGYIYKTIENDATFDCIIPFDVKLVCCDYFGYPLCCIALKRNVNKIYQENENMNNRNIGCDYKEFIETQISLHRLRELNEKDIDIILSLFIAIGLGHIGCSIYCHSLINKTNKIKPTLNNKSPFVVATNLDHISMDIIDVILEPQININEINDDGFSKLMVASKYDLTHSIKILLNPSTSTTNIDINYKEPSHGFNALNISCKHNKINPVQLLLENKNLLINQRTNDGSTSLYIASSLGYIDIVELLLKNGADPNLCTINNCTPLWIASCNGHLKIVELLLKYKSNPNIFKNNGCSPLWISLIKKHFNISMLLMQKMYNLNQIQTQQLLNDHYKWAAK